ncbi:N-methyl-L-tryptophan oxidase [Virgibacillus sp. W0430]|uniref:N-methyl-L-tryptophan oxidase n=1 Tax=Virgibacillus sp. W0430 TaxID=3391580 RepID=UPI003F47B043
MNADVIIIGAGSVGMAAGYYLSKQNKHVVLIDSNDPPHEKGSHHGATRIIRHAYGEGASYVPMALRAQKLWEELEKESKRTLFYRTGVLNIGPSESSFIQNVIKSAKQYQLHVEQLSAKEIRTKWKGFTIPSHLIGCYEPQSGVLMSEACVMAYKKQAMKNGAIFLKNTNVRSINTQSELIKVQTNQQTIQGEQLIITAGKGTNDILSMIGEKLPLQPMRKTFSWFHAKEELYKAGRFPAWTYDLDGETYYCFPSIEKSGLKIGRHDGGIPVSSKAELEPYGTYREDYEDVSKLLQMIVEEPMEHDKGKVCTYTNTPDGHFIIDKLKNHKNVFVSCGFSGHGFKFSSVVGEILSKMATASPIELNIKDFAIERFRNDE